MLGIILGSGLGKVAEGFEVLESRPAEEILETALAGKTPPLGHSRRFLKARHKGHDLAIFQGRLHYYEGFSMEMITEPIRKLKNLGAQAVILTFACGAIKKSFKTGDLVVVTDHMHLFCPNPLRGTTQFVDCTEVYDRQWGRELLKLARKLKIRASAGVYATTPGPTYETPSEVNALAKLGADVVGMSLTAEALMARSLGMKVIGLGWVSNMASGLVPKQKLLHQEVLELAQTVQQPFARLLAAFLDAHPQSLSTS